MEKFLYYVSRIGFYLCIAMSVLMVVAEVYSAIKHGFVASSFIIDMMIAAFTFIIGLTIKGLNDLRKK